MHITLGQLSICAAAIVCLSVPALGVSPTEDEFARCRSWVQRNFQPVRTASPASSGGSPDAAGMMVLANSGDVLFNGRPDGRHIKIGATEYEHGLICHAISRVVVRLPAPGKRFDAIVGVDTNAGGGSIIFSVKVDGKEAFRSDVMHCSQPGVRVSVDLNGARSFTIEAGDAGDGITCDHADWAEAVVTLQDCREIRLSDMSVVKPGLPSRAAPTPPFSFIYDGRPSDELLGEWEFSEATKKLDGHRIRRTQRYADPKTGLELRCEIVEYGDFPTVEWTVYLRNTGKSDTPIIESIQALDTTMTRGSAGEFVLHHAVGSPQREDDYEPLTTLMGPSVRKVITGAGGRPTSSDLCYFNIEEPGRQGTVLALGWPGQWSASFIRSGDHDLRVAAGQELTHLKLRPGEEIRTPLVAMQFWQGGDWERAQNIWRQWMVAHNMPHPGGKPVAAQYGECGGNPLPMVDEEMALIGGMIDDGIKMDHWIIDAGWYVNRNGWTDTGTWEVDKKRFPQGLRQVADLAHQHRMDFIVWFEPERVNVGTWLAENHPEWVLGGKGGGLLNLGDPDARKWITNRVDTMLTEEGIDHYRGDFNIDPLSYWRANDAGDRMGMTENAYVQGFLAFWDELLRRHPHMYIDTCASGGRRNDLETLRRSIPLLRSDWAVAAFSKEGSIGQQCQSYGISYWIPYHGTGGPSLDLYTTRSSIAPCYRVGYDPRDPNRHKDLMLRTVSDYRAIQPYFLDDFYPLTAYSRSKDSWIAWQYNSPERAGGAVMAFRRDNSAQASMTFMLRGLDSDAEYIVTSRDGRPEQRAKGRSLMSDGLAVTIDDKPGSAMFTYRKAGQ